MGEEFQNVPRKINRHRNDSYDYVKQRFGVSKDKGGKGKILSNGPDPFDNSLVYPTSGNVMNSSRKDVNVAEAVRDELFVSGLIEIGETSSKSNKSSLIRVEVSNRETGTRRDYKLTNPS